MENKIVEWDSSQEGNPEFLISYYKSRIAHWQKYPEHINKKII